MNAGSALQTGLVVSTHGRHCVVETATGQRVICHPRGKKSLAVVGDHVQWLASQDEGTIERVLERRNLLYRQDDIRTKQFAANLDQVLILVAAVPEFSEPQLARALIACEAAHIAPLIVLNKADLQPAFAHAWQRLAPYRAMDYPVLALAAKPRSDLPAEQANALALLQQHLCGRTTLILGPSGAGKSTLVNRLVPGADVQTGEISQALNTGKHTTTSTRWYWVDDAPAAASPIARTADAPDGGGAVAHPRTALIDSPGFQEFGLHHIAPTQLAACMPDLRVHVAQCKFYNCTHLHEPGCGVRAAVHDSAAANPISKVRYKIYSDLFAELSQPPY